MSDLVISAEGLGKKYIIGHQSGDERYRYKALRDVLAQTVRGWSRTARDMLRGQPIVVGDVVEEFWALKDVNFEVKRGEVLGIIGPNGAGKSTLLKVLSRITEPSTGRVTIDGRVASLLEVGTGFHPELTGRENIYLNGAILGMTRAEIRRKFDEIVAFAEVEKFLDTPVKRYSSGMYVRLAFAVAAHLEPEILVVDEVLAVGDAEFQKKCLGKMKDVSRGGRTVLFVSHNMNAVENLCTEAMMLDRGIVRDRSTKVRSVIASYLSRAGDGQATSSSWANHGNAFDHPVMQPLYFAVVDETGQPLTTPVRNDAPIFVMIRAEIRQLDPALNMGFSLFNENGQELLCSLTTDRRESKWPSLEPGLVELRCDLPIRFLNEGAYRLELFCSLHCRDWFVRPTHNSPSIHFSIRGGLSDSPYWTFARAGILAPEWSWVRTL